MKKYLQKKLNNEKGMTLIELLAVIVIIAIIAAIAIPAIGNIIENSRVGAIKSDYVNALAAADLYALDFPEDDEITLANLQGTPDSGSSTEVYLDDKGSILTFVYDTPTRKFVGTTKANNVTLNTNAPASKQDVSAIANNAKAATYTKLTLVR